MLFYIGISLVTVPVLSLIALVIVVEILYQLEIRGIGGLGLFIAWLGTFGFCLGIATLIASYFT